MRGQQVAPINPMKLFEKFRAAVPKPREHAICRICGTEAPVEGAYFFRSWFVCPTCMDALRSLIEGSSKEDDWLLWLRQAEENLDVGSEMQRVGRYHFALYFAHQAMEAGLKALLVERGSARGWLGSHSIHALLRRVAVIETFERFAFDAWRLDLYYYATRYPMGETAKLPRDFFTDPNDAAAALQAAAELLNAVRACTGSARDRGEAL